MTAEDIEARNYVYCSATYSDPLRWEKFLAPHPTNRNAALIAATDYATAQWGEPVTIRLYPRNYVKEARRLFAAGRIAPAATRGLL